MEQVNNQKSIRALALMMAESETTEYPRFNIPVPTDFMFELLMKTYKSAVDKTYIQFCDDDFTRDKLEKVAEWATSNNRRNSLLLCGGVGSGKSTILKALSKAIKIIKDVAVRKNNSQMNIPKDKQELYSAISRVPDLVIVPSEEAANNPDKYKDAPFLALDDFGYEFTVHVEYGNRTTPLISLLFRRYEKKLPTIITTNLDFKDIEDKYSSRLLDRMKEDYDRLVFKNESYRIR